MNPFKPLAIDAHSNRAPCARKMSSLDGLFFALSSPTRRTMLCSLTVGNKTISELALPLSMTFPAASKHVRVLEKSGLVIRRIEGSRHVISAVPNALSPANDWLQDLEAWIDILTDQS